MTSTRLLRASKLRYSTASLLDVQVISTSAHHEKTSPTKILSTKLRVSSSSWMLGALYTMTTAMAKACTEAPFR